MALRRFPAAIRLKVFRDTAVTNLTEFFDRFRMLNVRSNEQLDKLVANARQVVSGVEPQQLRENDSMRQYVATQLSKVQSSLDGLMVHQFARWLRGMPVEADTMVNLLAGEMAVSDVAGC